MNNLKKLICGLFIAVGIIAGTGYRQLAAQDTLAFSPVGFIGMPDTAFAGDSIAVGFFLKNLSATNAFTDSFRVDGYVDTGLVVNFSYDYYTLYQNQWALMPGDSDLFLLPVSFRPGNQGGNFRAGNNIIVVWPVPIGGVFGSRDTLTANVFLIDTLSSVNDLSMESHIRVYPVPSRGPLHISAFHPQHSLEEIIIHDINGRIVFHSFGPSVSVNTEEWATGIYTIQARLSNGRVSYYKIMRE